MANMSAEIEAVFRAEERQGYLDSSVLGGFGEWLCGMSGKVQSASVQAILRELGEAYTDGALAERPGLWRQAYACLSDKSLVIAAPQKQVAPTPKTDALRVSIEYLKGVGPKRAVLLRRLGIYTVADLLFNYPRDYERRPEPVLMGMANEGETVVICGQILSKTTMRPNKRLSILKVLLSDGTDNITAVWYNQVHLEAKMIVGKKIEVYGKLERRFGNRELSVMDYEFAEEAEEKPSGSAILPVYALTANLTQKSMRKLVATAWEKYAPHIDESLPPELLAQNSLLSLREALYNIHFPKTDEDAERGRQRLAYEELLVTQLTVLANRLPDSAQSVRRNPGNSEFAEFCAVLPFPLTGAQNRVITEIYADMERSQPMRRLVQGDVGSGKTAVAAAALYKNCRAGLQGALMAPTEILAGQHYKNLQPLLGALGLKVALLTGDTKTAERREILISLAEGRIDVLVGTHALFSADVEFAALGLAVTDEQHRFGVNQRSALRRKGNLADVLVLTATPIPRTLAMTFCGDLDVSVIDELPPGRQPIQTFAVSYELEERALNFVCGELAKGRQAYIVCPLVEENEKMELDSAIKLTERLQTKEFAAYRVALLHGKMKPAEKNDVMSRFSAGEIQVLVSTTVIEVGVDVPNATIMLVRDAERFGLAQLHQLRGRVGRGGEQSYCILLNNAKSKVARERIKTMTETNDGFVIAEADLKLRGAGELLGTRQSGLAALKYADLAKDLRLVEAARKNAMRLLQNDEYLQYPALAREVRRRTELMES